MTSPASASATKPLRRPVRPFGGAPPERRAWLVAAISLVVMVAEVSGGVWLNSLALLSDGVHTATHAAVMVMAGAAYMYARTRRNDPRFLAGPAKATDLAAFASGMVLAMTALLLAGESARRLLHPEAVRFREAAEVTAAGLLVSLGSAVLLRNANASLHIHGPAQDRGRRDLNLWAAYLHMAADVVTSVIALLALAAGAVTGWTRLDAAVGILNAAVVAAFAVKLLREAAAALLDYDPGRRPG